MPTDELKIKIPDQHYVGMQKRDGDDLPLGFMTPDGTDSAAIKRKETVDRWAGGGYGKTATLPPQMFKNTLMAGFSLVRSIKRYGWNGGNVVWRIADPRGFELEISSHNLAQILRYCIIDQGEILSKCIWGRLGSDNVLIPEGSDVYQNAIKNTDRQARKIATKDLKRGMKIQLQNGMIGVYLGAFFTIDYGGDEEDTFKISKSRKHCIVSKFKDNAYVDIDPLDTYSNNLSVITDLKVSDVLDEPEELPLVFCERYINEYHLKNKRIDYSSTAKFAGAVSNKLVPANINIVETPFDITDL